jgi:hypothetical protein
MLTAPNGGETLTVGSIYNITWSSTGSLGSVNLDYSTDNGLQWHSIVTETANSGIYAWTVSNVLSTNCLVRVRNSRFTGVPADVSDGVFTIQESLALQLVSPNGSEVMEAGETF